MKKKRYRKIYTHTFNPSVVKEFKKRSDNMSRDIEALMIRALKSDWHGKIKKYKKK